MALPTPPFTDRVVLYCPTHGDRYLRVPGDPEPFPDPAVCGYPLGRWPDACTEPCTPDPVLSGIEGGQ